MRIHCAGERIWFDVIGEKEQLVDGRRIEKPTLVFVHGGGGNHASSRPWANRFSDIAQCVLLDLPGHGRSSRSSEARWNLEYWGDAVAEFCEALDIRQPIIHGGSMGGFVAQSLATRHPGLAGGIILLSTAARRDRELVARRFGELGGPEAKQAFLNTLEVGAPPSVFAEFMRIGMPLYSTRHGQQTLPLLNRYSMLGPTERMVFNEFQKPGGAFDSFDFRAALRHVSTPTLIIAGRQDPVTPVEGAQEMLASFAPGVARLEILEQASHLVNEDQTDDYVRLVREFVLAANH